jgi:crotonobetainyl-CoA:carnitine CoA-transferase CaiB-like acyl-CoA transferase
MAPPLAGIRIIEIGQMIAVPAATYQLATQGATVIKVEDVAHGDELRHYGSHKGGISAWFISANSGKRSIAIDLRDADGKAILWKLLAEADVVVQGFRPGALARLGFGAEAVLQRHPSIVYCSSSGFGATGPYANLPVYDPVIQSLAGWAGGQANDTGPTLIRAMVADKIAALTTAQAITAGLVQRGATGQGLHIEMGMLETNIDFVWPDTMMHATLLDEDAVHRPNLAQAYRLFACQDGWISIAAGTDGQWAGLSRALARRELAEDERFKTASARAGNVGAWYDAMESAVRPFTVAEAVQRLRENDVPVAPVLDPTEVVADPQVVAQGIIREVTHPVAGRLLQPRPTAAWFGSDLELSPAPMHGEHTDEILAELSYTSEAIRALRDAGTVGRQAPAPT